VGQSAHPRVIYTPHSKVYHFLQSSTLVLKRLDPDGYREIFVKNTWV
jgi:hypothetical protein